MRPTWIQFGPLFWNHIGFPVNPSWILKWTHVGPIIGSLFVLFPIPWFNDGSTSDPSRNHICFFVDPFWDHAGPLWAHFGPMLVLFESTMDHCWDQLGPSFEPSWFTSGSILDMIWILLRFFTGLLMGQSWTHPGNTVVPT